MSEMLKHIQDDMIRSMKSGEKARKDVLSQLISRAKLIAKNDKNREVTDRDVIQAVEKTVKDVNDTKQFAIQANREVTKFDFEISIVSQYLPQQLTKEELTSIVTSLVREGPEGKAVRGFVMKNMNADYKGKFNPQDVNQILSDMGV
jgi:uncharacterized protein